jgi:peptidoglycan hydrolase-like protein with peptidoglycan-binding domain/predicted chitinase
MTAKRPMLQPGDGIEYPEYADDVKFLEQFLQDIKLLPPTRPNEGRFDIVLEQAVRRFQKQHGLVTDGIVGAGTWAEIDDIIVAQQRTTDQPLSVLPETLPELQRGAGLNSPDQMDAVKRLQMALQNNRYFDHNAKLDGVFGARTEQALKQFQADRDLDTTGTTTPDTWVALLGLPPREKMVRHMPILRFGDGLEYPALMDDVKTLQQALQREGFFDQDMPIDGHFDSATQDAVKAFQRSATLVSDGIVGQETWSSLLRMPLRAYTPDRGQGSMTSLTPPTPSPDVGYNLDKIVASIPYPAVREYAHGSIPLLFKACTTFGVTDTNQIAYILATVEHESMLGQWTEEFASGQAYEWRSDLGNNQWGDGPRFKGRGYIQITGRDNYKRWSQLLGVDLIREPHRASEPDLAAEIAVRGMRDGSFTGHRLDDHINEDKQDFYNARRIVNGLDRAEHIAAIAREYVRVLK